MPEVAAPAQLDALLEGLNEPQRDAVTHGDGPLLILAGAGSGKTRVLTHRIAWMVGNGHAQAGEILAITFTNKAATEMRERAARLVDGRVRAMWLMTFHAACARMLRAEAPRLGYTRQFSIYDQADARRLTKRSLDELGIDPKRFTPAAVHHQISDAKNKLRDADAYGKLVGSYFEQTVADVYRVYERELHRMNAMDFDDLLVRAVNVLELFPEVRERYATAFRHVLVDEYQDTNHAQYRWLGLLASEHRNLAVVGDDDQCLVAGTPVTMADGSTRPIEGVLEGDVVLSCHGSGDLRPARVIGTSRATAAEGVAITTASGRRLVSTPEHTHFAGYKLGLTPQLHMTYLMWKRGIGFRLGTSRTYTDGQVKPVVGFIQRARQEHADAVWVVSTRSSEAEARVAETVLSLRYGIPTIPFVARSRPPDRGLVGSQVQIDKVFAQVRSEAGGRRLLAELGLDAERSHYLPQGYGDRRRNVTLVLCGDRRGPTPMHRMSVFGYDDDGRRTLEEAGVSVRPARRGSPGWRHESAYKDFGAVMDHARRVSSLVGATIRPVARLGANAGLAPEGNSLPFISAANVQPGMVMFTDGAGYDVVDRVERVALDAPVYDIDIEGTHNFVAGGLLTHNSVYGFRGADVRNILDFEDDYPDAHIVRLEQNYRSTQTILSAANAVVANNRGRRSKTLWTDGEQGDQVHMRELDDEHAEARFVAGEIERLVDEGASRSEIAVFYRTNAQSRVLEDTLVRAQIGYQVIGGTKFYERAEIKDAIAYLTVLVNPQDVVSFARIVGSPRRGIGATSLQRVVAHANTLGEPVWEVAAAADQVPGLGAAAVKAFARFMGALRVLRERAESGAPIAEILSETLHETGYRDALEAERTIEAQGRMENLDELLEVAREYDGTSPDPTLDDFLQQIALVSDADTIADDEGVVTLMTLHNAKGLEYPVVLMIGCEEGVFPHSRALDEGGLEEERRLCYVGITRARRELYVTWARSRNVFGSRTFGGRSRFVDEIPAELTDREALAAPATGAGAGRAGGWGAQRDAPPPTAYRVGEDVGHAAFGEGVVTGVEPGGIVVVRFARDGVERKLVAELAPLSRR